MRIIYLRRLDADLSMFTDNPIITPTAMFRLIFHLIKTQHGDYYNPQHPSPRAQLQPAPCVVAYFPTYFRRLAPGYCVIVICNTTTPIDRARRTNFTVQPLAASYAPFDSGMALNVYDNDNSCISGRKSWLYVMRDTTRDV